MSLERAVQLETVDGDLEAAIAQYEQIVEGDGNNRALVARALLRLGGCHEKLGRAEARKVYQRLVDAVIADERVTQTPSRASLPGAQALTVAEGRAVHGEAMIVGREFAHIHQQPGAGSLHLRLREEEAADVVAKGWGEWHPFALGGSAPGMVMVYSPRNTRDLEVIAAIVASAVDHATPQGSR